MIQPDQYSENLDPFVHIVRDLYDKNIHLIQWNSEPESVMDLGIGDGRMSEEVILPMIPKPLREYVGVDISQIMLESAKEKITHDQFTTILLDAGTSNLPDEVKNRFHHIFSSFLFHHVKDVR